MLNVLVGSPSSVIGDVRGFCISEYIDNILAAVPLHIPPLP